MSALMKVISSRLTEPAEQQFLKLFVIISDFYRLNRLPHDSKCQVMAKIWNDTLIVKLLTRRQTKLN